MTWVLSHRFDQISRRIADRHYNRQSPGAAQFVPPGRCLVLRHSSGRALWVTSFPFAEYTKHEWAGAWVNSLFRNEGAGLSSDLIRKAVAATRWYARQQSHWTEPESGMITFVDADAVDSRNPGYCYECAGFKRVGYTKGGLHAWQLLPADMPSPECPQGAQLMLGMTTLPSHG